MINTTKTRLTANEHWQLLPKSFKFLLVVVLAIGIFFRFVNLDKKIYWGDEAGTSIWISGHTSEEVRERLYTGEIIQVEDLQKYQKIFPGKGVIDTVNAVAKDTPLHTPLYFAMVRLWVGIFGDSIAAIRAFSAVISLCVFPAIYWLCLELFNSSLVGWIAIAITAVSPYQVLYAQEARPYILWAVTILLSSACLLRAIRINKPLNWGIYAIALAASLYTNVFSVLVAIGQGIYILVIQGFRFNKIFSKIVINYLLASFGGILLFSPWMSLLINYQIHRETEPGTPFLALSKRLIGIISRIFLDVGIDSSDEIKKALPLIIPILLILITIGWSFYFLYRTTRKATWWFVFTLTGCCLIPFFIRDILTTTGTFLISNRYLFPCYLGIEIAVAYLLAQKITEVKIHWQQKFWQLVFLTLLSAGILSGIVSSQAEVWWHKGGPITKHELEIVYTINQSSHPLIVSDAGLWNIMNLSSKLDSKVRLQLFDYLLDPTIRFQRLLEPEVIAAYDGYSDVFLFRPSEELLNQFEKINHHKLKSVKEEILWKK